MSVHKLFINFSSKSNAKSKGLEEKKLHTLFKQHKPQSLKIINITTD